MKIEDIVSIGVIGFDLIKIPIIKTYGFLRGIKYETVYNEDYGFIELRKDEKTKKM
jgi:hypothetical protein